jgi:(2R)-3-sulfolactate dehydrogenase (NADP+)
VAVAIGNSHHCGVAGHHVERLAAKDLVGLMFANTPAAIAPAGGRRALFGTNPVAAAFPRRDKPPLVVDLSMSTVARGKVVAAAQKGEPIPEGWSLDAAGEPTTDAKAALQGTMVPIGGAKGAALALVVELFAGALCGAAFAWEASSFFESDGPPPRVGQFFLVLDPSVFGPGVVDRIETLCETVLAEPGTRLPGDRRLAIRERLAREGVPVPDALMQDLHRRA